jgi:hypothetical protein
LLVITSRFDVLPRKQQCNAVLAQSSSSFTYTTTTTTNPANNRYLNKSYSPRLLPISNRTINKTTVVPPSFPNWEAGTQGVNRQDADF